MDKIGYLVLFFSLALIYFRIAKKYNILDKPNHRSSHSHITIRGGGILFLIAGLLAPFISGNDNLYYLAALLLIGTVSFWDDLKNLPGMIRFTVQAFSVAIVIYSFKLDINSIIQVIIGIGILGALNIYNFMDGINGITGLYSLAILLSLFYVDIKTARFIHPDYISLPLLAAVVFLFFNLRKKAVCFAGDVGSVSVAFIILFLTGKLIIVTADTRYALFLLVYGLDGVSTILFRFIRGEKLGEAHRFHFYQYLANERKWPHAAVASLFALLQLLVNAGVIWLKIPLLFLLLIIFITFLGFVSIRLYLQGARKLLKQI